GLTLFCSRVGLGSLWTRIVLHEKEVDNARLEWVLPGQLNQDLLVLNPSLDLPTLADRDTVIHPASVIVEYLDERYPHPKLMPPDPAARARLRMVLLRFEQQLFPWAERILADGKSPEAKEARQALADALAGSLRMFPARGWFLGLDYNLVDCAWAALMSRLPALGLKLGGDTQALSKYGERLLARPSVRAALA
ncbi:MAG: glutathione S-transferase N-terminal domain-containing protein, partial [Burkholderiales bacterium]